MSTHGANGARARSSSSAQRERQAYQRAVAALERRLAPSAARFHDAPTMVDAANIFRQEWQNARSQMERQFWMRQLSAYYDRVNPQVSGTYDTGSARRLTPYQRAFYQAMTDHGKALAPADRLLKAAGLAGGPKTEDLPRQMPTRSRNSSARGTTTAKPPAETAQPSAAQRSPTAEAKARRETLIAEDENYTRAIQNDLGNAHRQYVRYTDAALAYARAISTLTPASRTREMARVAALPELARREVERALQRLGTTQEAPPAPRRSRARKSA